jgi:nucleotide-binding universal stress UspA family protein
MDRNRQDSTMSRHVVVGYDGSLGGRAASAEAIALAKRQGDCDVVVVCTHERLPDFSKAPFLLGRIDERRWLRDWNQQTGEDLKHEVMRIRLAGVDAVAICSPEDPVRLLKEVASEVEAEFIVVPDDRGSVLHDLFVGSTTRRLKRTCKVPVLVVGDVR